jgi:predicted transglutaminase-like cysteine proteinase
MSIRHLTFAACASISVSALSTIAWSQSVNPSQSQDRNAPWLRVYGVTQPPYGAVEFCQREAAECREGPMEEQRRAGTREEIAELDRVNRAVNKEIEPVTDHDQHGMTEFWTIPRSGKGDCEEYALLKRQRLIKAGWPASALLVTVVLDENKDGHAVLTARTVTGDFVLDNKTDELRLWHKTPYHFLMRQSYLNPRVWMSLDPKEAAPSVPVAGVRRGDGAAATKLR